MLARAPVVIAVGADSPVGQFGDLLDRFTAQPGIQMYSSSGLCSYSDFVGQYMTRRASVDVVPVAYRGGHDAAQAAIRGDVHMVVTELPSAVDDISAGRLKVLATSSEERLRDAPTFEEVGYKELNQLVWYGFFVPAETPSREGRIMQAAIQEILKDPEVLRQLEALGAEPYTLSGAEIYREVVNLTRAIEGFVDDAGLQLE